MKKIKFDCGCSVSHMESWDNINLDCSATWDMIGEGLTKGVFQLESQLGRNWAKKLKPRNIEELSDVISLIRPGCLEAEFREDPETGKMLSIISTYEKVKMGGLESEYIHESLEPIFSKTHGVPVYQEQIMSICSDFAGFSLREADIMRKAVGKKNPELMEELKEKFIEKAISKGRDEEISNTIFSWINDFSRYGFNKSHGISYAMIGYQMAYAKRHFPAEFLKNKLTHSDSKPDQFDEIKQLVYESRLFNLDVITPDVRRMNQDFVFTEDKKLAFGLSHIKGVGPKSFGSLKLLLPIEDFYDLLRLVLEGVKVNKGVLLALVKSGALDHLGTNRIRMLAWCRFVYNLTKKEKRIILENFDEVVPLGVDKIIIWLVESGLKDDRCEKISEGWNTIKKEEGGNTFKMSLGYEKLLLGMPLSGNETDMYSNYRVNTTCVDFLRLRNKTKCTLGVIIEEIREITDKKLNKMCFMKVSDATYMLDGIVVFSRQFEKFNYLIEPGKVILLNGRKDGGSFLVNYIEHL